MGQYDGWREYVPKEIRLPDGSVIPNALTQTPKKRGKYNAVPHTVLPDLMLLPSDECAAVPGGIRFDSKREAERFIVLRQQQERGEISCLQLQSSIALHVFTTQGIKVPVGSWVADFTYVKDHDTVVEDCKGCRTALYLWKKKHVEREYGIRILET